MVLDFFGIVRLTFVVVVITVKSIVVEFTDVRDIVVAAPGVQLIVIIFVGVVLHSKGFSRTSDRSLCCKVSLFTDLVLRDITCTLFKTSDGL